MSRSDDEAAVRDVLSGYCHRCDDGSFDELVALFAPDGEFVVRGESVTGRPVLREYFERAQPPARRGKHLTLNSIVVVDGDRASARSDFVFLRYEHGVLAPAITGRYIDELVRIGGAWCLARRVVDMLAPPGSVPAH